MNWNRNAKYSLGLTRDITVKHLQALKSDVEKTLDGKCRFMYDEVDLLGNGSISEHEFPPVLHIGIHGLHESDSLGTYVSDLDFTRAVVTAFHELRHFQQSTDLEQSTEHPRAIALALADMANRYNGAYYSENYVTNAREIDAEQYGIIGAYEWMSKVFSKETAEKLLVDYANFRSGYNPESGRKFAYFVERYKNRPFKSFNQVTAAFDDAFDQAKSAPRKYPMFGKDVADSVGVLLDSDNPKSAWSEFSSKLFDLERFGYLQENAGLEMDKHVASLIAYGKPELQSRYKALDGLDLSVKTVWELEPPDTVFNAREVFDKAHHYNHYAQAEARRRQQEAEYIVTMMRKPSVALAEAASDMKATVIKTAMSVGRPKPPDGIEDISAVKLNAPVEKQAEKQATALSTRDLSGLDVKPDKSDDKSLEMQ